MASALQNLKTGNTYNVWRRFEILMKTLLVLLNINFIVLTVFIISQSWFVLKLFYCMKINKPPKKYFNFKDVSSNPAINDWFFELALEYHLSLNYWKNSELWIFLFSLKLLNVLKRSGASLKDHIILCLLPYSQVSWGDEERSLGKK